MFIISFFTISMTTYCNAKTLQDIDSLGNLWIITIDKSGSMLWNSNHQYESSKRFSIANNVAKRLNAITQLDEINYRKDRFLFFNSGILQVKDLTRLQNIERFDISFIHHTDKTLHDFENKIAVISKIQNQLKTSTTNINILLFR